MFRRTLLAFLMLAGGLPSSVPADAVSAKRKIELIEKERLRPGSQVSFSAAELNAWVRDAVTREFPGAVRNPLLSLGPGTATGSALVDFGKLRRVQGQAPGWMLAQVLNGERPVRVTARLSSAGGKATVDVQSVEVSGMSIEGPLLDFLIRNYVLPNYPAAKVGEPFALGHHVEKLEVLPSAVNVLIGR